MSDLCSCCGFKEVGRDDTIQFEYRGLSISMFKSGVFCRDCTIQGARGFLEEFRGCLFSIGKKQVRPDWAFYLRLKGKNQDDASEALLHLGVLSQEAVGNWQMVCGGQLSMNPQTGGLCLYFTQEQDARGFAKIAGKEKTYSWHLQQVGKVVTKEEILSPKTA